MLLIAWLLIMGGLYWFFSDWNAKQANPNTARVLSLQQGEVTLARNGAGHYVAEGEINGRRVVFLLDTGATAVAGLDVSFMAPIVKGLHSSTPPWLEAS